MNTISVNEFSTYRWPFFKDVVQYSKFGYSAIGLWRSKVEDFGQEEAIDLLHEMKMGVSSVSWAGGFTGGDGRSFENAIEDAKEAIRLASAVSANCLIVHPGSRNCHTNTHSRRLINKALTTLVPYAADYDVCLAIEPMSCGSCRQWTFIDNLKQSLDVIEEFSSHSLGVVLDLFHFGLCPELAQLLPQLVERIRLVQVADKKQEIKSEDNRCSLGTGRIPISQRLATLASLGYDGPVEIELHGFDMDGVNYCQMLQDSFQFVQACELIKESQFPTSSLLSQRSNPTVD